MKSQQPWAANLVLLRVSAYVCTGWICHIWVPVLPCKSVVGPETGLRCLNVTYWCVENNQLNSVLRCELFAPSVTNGANPAQESADAWRWRSRLKDGRLLTCFCFMKVTFAGRFHLLQPKPALHPVRLHAEWHSLMSQSSQGTRVTGSASLNKLAVHAEAQRAGHRSACINFRNLPCP